MASKTERALVSGTDNVFDLEKYRSLKRMSDIIGLEPDIFTFDDIDDPPPLRWEPSDYLGHHARMVKATNKIKARRDFIDGNSTES